MGHKAAYRPHAALSAVELDINVLRVVGEWRRFPATGQHGRNRDYIVNVLDGMCGILARDADGLESEWSALALGVRGRGS